MNDEQSFSFNEFSRAFKGFLDQVAAQAPAEEPPITRRLREHFACDLNQAYIVSQSFELAEQANVQVALDAYLAVPGRRAELLGVTHEFSHMSFSLSVFAAGTSAGRQTSARFGPVQYATIALGGDRHLACVESGLYLIDQPEGRMAVLVHAGAERFKPKVAVEVMSRSRSDAERFLADLRNEMCKCSVYRGRVVSLSSEDAGNTTKVQFHSLPRIGRGAIILPDGLLERIERHTLGFARHAEKLRAAGRHLKRGILLHGVPGTGKTLTAMYLAQCMNDRSVILLTSAGSRTLAKSCSMARLLEPSILIMEDVDLIAQARSSAPSPLLMELLNEMEGLSDDADILFLLTTNRPEALESALASRPGRVDQAIEIPLPNARCRERLIDLYSRGIVLDLADRKKVVQRTSGASAAFIRELMRKATLFAAEEGSEMVVSDHHVDEAFRELTVDGGELTQSFLGFHVPG